MKRILFPVLCLSLLLQSFSVYAATDVKIYPVDSALYRAISELSVLQGLSLPSTSGPWSEDELRSFLDRIDEKTLAPDALPTYRHVAKALGQSIPSFSLGARASAEAYLHTNTSDYVEEADWAVGYAERPPMLSVPLEISLADRFYAYARLDLANARYDTPGDFASGTSILYGRHVLTTNLPNFWFPDADLVIDANVPYRAFGAFGGPGWVFQIGRDAISWGPGITGNFLLDGHVQYHNAARFSAYGPRFKYTFVTSFFPSPDEIEAGGGQGSPLMGLKMFMAHRFEWRLFDDRLNLVLNEGIMYQPENGILDLRILNPMMVYHNYFIRSDANSIASIEADYALYPGWNLYGQMVFDELAFGPTEWNLETGRHPDGVGLMLGTRMVRALGKGMLTASLEGAYTTPYLYLRSKDGDKAQKSEDSSDTLDFVVALRRWIPDHLIYDRTYMGYPYGGDAIVGNLQVGYERYGLWSVNARLLYLVHGDIDMDSPWELFDIGNDPATPTGSPRHTIVFGGSGTKTFNGHLEGRAGIYLVTDIEEYVPRFDLQLNCGISYTF